LVVGQLDRFANGLKPVEVDRFLRERGHEVRLVNTYYLSRVALLNSLRLIGHGEPIFLVDAGLTAQQRDLLGGHTTLVPAPEDAPAVFLTPLGPMRHPADVAILLDADVR
jgi:hypothetical protein